MSKDQPVAPANETAAVRVRYIGASYDQVAWGSNDDPRGVLTEQAIYTLAREEVHTLHTKYELAEFPGKVFNSVCFENETAAAQNRELREQLAAKASPEQIKAMQFAAENEGYLARAFGLAPAWGLGGEAFTAEIIHPCIAAGWMEDHATYITLTATGREILRLAAKSPEQAAPQSEPVDWYGIALNLCNGDMARLAMLASSEQPAHTDHPLRHWDMTCPACQAEGE